MSSTVSVLDVAKYILGQADKPMTTMKLQKLCYYSQAWHLAWRGRPLIAESFQAWANGPVCRPLFAVHRGRYVIDGASFEAGNPGGLSVDQKQVIDDVLRAYLPLDGAQLSDLTHAEEPWLKARRGLPDDARSEVLIKTESMRKFYRSLQEDDPNIEAVEDMNWPDNPWAP